MECRKRETRESGMALLQSGQHIGPKLNGSVVARVKRHPGHWWVTKSKRTNPVGEQRGLSKACGGRDEDDALVEASIEQGQETRASNDLMGGGRGRNLVASSKSGDKCGVGSGSGALL
ncbi:hypothetical protein KSB_88010 [Ktedonobacter robiniae]|uniref:Uncharacterized protein n=1 Tax=Ktedonobacter robiniae TaxID=2778365 RepID=A0ABQ3V578_9CHLR|nr:hypothetical protein KSB_88010 [Ktedonobacter robiniae]